MSQRIHAFDAIENVRDYGDYATASGLRLRPGRLLRSGHHARATAADLDRLQALGVAVVVDLRRSGERHEQPSRRHPGFSGQVIESDDTERAEPPHMAFLRTTDLTPSSVRDFMIATYRDMPYDERIVGLYRRYFQALAEADGAVLIHCAAGKDRTGLLAALTHHVAGVREADLLEDYLLTNTAVRLEQRAPEVAERIERMYGTKASHEAVRAFLGVTPEFLEAAFASIEARNGSLDGYLGEVLGVDAALAERIRARLLA